jgi:branched-chain amino acid aminotransferase
LNEGRRAKAPEVILLNSRGFVAEGSTSNVFIIKNQTLITPSLDSGILEGITRRLVLHLGRQLGLRCQERWVRPSELYAADELFFTGTVREITPVRRLHKTPIVCRSKIHYVPLLVKAFKGYIKQHLK